MKILVSGCSISYGYGFPLSINDPNIWPNLLAQKVNAEVNNISIPGYDNCGIFLNALREFTTKKYDLILIQLTGLDRVIVSPNMHSIMNLTYPESVAEYYKFFDTEKKLVLFKKQFFRLNQQYEHWKRLINIIVSVQNLVEQGKYNIKFVNGMIHWNEEFFNTDQSNFAKDILDFHNLPDKDIKKGLNKINLDKALINFKLWINLFNCFKLMQIDQVSEFDTHPGPESHKIYTNLILDNL